MIFDGVDFSVKEGDENLPLTDNNILNIGFVEYVGVPSGEGVFVNPTYYPVSISFWRNLNEFSVGGWFWQDKAVKNIKELKKHFKKHILEQPKTRVKIINDRINKIR